MARHPHARRRRGHAAARHSNPPFVEDSELTAAVIAGLRDVVAAFAPFDVRLGAFARFDADPPVLFLVPEPSGPLLALMAAIEARFPQHPPFGGLHETVIPHMTVASTDVRRHSRRWSVTSPRTSPSPPRVDAVDVMEHRGQGGWRRRQRFPLMDR